MAIWKLSTAVGPRLASGPADSGPRALLPAGLTIDDLLAEGGALLDDSSTADDGDPVPAEAVVAAPLGTQEVWAAGVTYLRSREARMEESEAPDAYDRVYVADRPELFFKAPAWRVRGPGEPVGIRGDSEWDVPEPELAVVADARGEIVAFAVGNDMSSRSIEGENPLYLPQAKVYTGAAALGPCLVPVAEAPPADEMVVRLRVLRDGAEVVSDEVSIASMKRGPRELVDWLFRALEFPVGVVLLTGTGIVPDPSFTLRAGDDVRIAITGLGELRNPVRVIDAAR